MKNQILTFIGSDAGFGNKNNSAYVETGSKFILIDCGFTVFNAIKNKFDFKKYSSIDIIVTHLHNDHAGSLSQFIMYLWYVVGIKSNVYCCCENIREYLDITGVPRDGYELYKSSPSIKFIKTEHAIGIDSYGFCLEINGKKIVYTGDTSIVEPFCDVLEDADEFYVDVSLDNNVHLKIRECIDFLKKIKEKRYYGCSNAP